MRIVIVGAGEVGSHLAKLLSDEEQDIMLVDADAERLTLLDANSCVFRLTVLDTPGCQL